MIFNIDLSFKSLVKLIDFFSLLCSISNCWTNKHQTATAAKLFSLKDIIMANGLDNCVNGEWRIKKFFLFFKWKMNGLEDYYYFLMLTLIDSYLCVSSPFVISNPNIQINWWFCVISLNINEIPKERKFQIELKKNERQKI